MIRIKDILHELFFKAILSLLAIIFLLLNLSGNAEASSSFESTLSLMQKPIPRMTNIETSNLSSTGELLGFLNWFSRDRPRRAGGKPSETTSGGRRGKCSTQTRLIAIVPPSEASSEPINSSSTRQSTLEYSFEESPSIWFYLSNPQKDELTAEFMIQEYQTETRQHLDITKPIKFDLSKSSSGQNSSGNSLISFSLNEAGLKLSPGKVYHWYVSLICQQEDGRRRPSREAHVNSWLAIETPAEDQSQELARLKQDTSREGYVNLLDWYFENGVWYDSLYVFEILRNTFNDTENLLETLENIGVNDALEVVTNPIYVVRF